MNKDIEKVRDRYINEVVSSKPEKSKENIIHVYTSIDNWNSNFKEFLKTNEIWEKDGYIEDFLDDNDLTIDDLDNDLIDEMVDYLYDEIMSFDYEIYDNYMNANFDGDSIFTTNLNTYDLLTDKAVSIDCYLEKSDNRGLLCYGCGCSKGVKNILHTLDLDDLYDIDISIDEESNNLVICGGTGNSCYAGEIKYVDNDLGDFICYDNCSIEMEEYIYDEIAIPLGYSIKNAMGYDVEVDLDEMRSGYYNKIVNSYIVSPDTYEDIYNTYKEELDKIDKDLTKGEDQEVMEVAITEWLSGDEDSVIHHNVYEMLDKDITPSEYTKNFIKQMDEYNLGKNQDINDIQQNEQKPNKKIKM